jgi:TPR repeat protein
MLLVARSLGTFAMVLACPAAIAGQCKSLVEPMALSRDPDSKPTFDLCRAEADDGDADALYFLSFFYFGSNSFAADESKGVATVRASAEKGYAQAQYWMGWQHEIGGHLPQDNAAAISWYEKAADAGFAMAFDRLERAYRNGELGLAVNHLKADSYARRRPRAIS